MNIQVYRSLYGFQWVPRGWIALVHIAKGPPNKACVSWAVWHLCTPANTGLWKTTASLKPRFVKGRNAMQNTWGWAPDQGTRNSNVAPRHPHGHHSLSRRSSRLQDTARHTGVIPARGAVYYVLAVAKPFRHVLILNGTLAKWMMELHPTDETELRFKLRAVLSHYTLLLAPSEHGRRKVWFQVPVPTVAERDI